MVKVKTDVKGLPLPCEMYLDGYLQGVLDDLSGFVDRDWDGFGMFTGSEGSGKTTLAVQCAVYLDNNFSLDRIVFNTKQFEEAVEKANSGDCIVWDESDAISKNWQSEVLVSITRLMKRIRSKNLFIFFVTPTFFDAGKYFAVHRARFMIYTYAKGYERGFFRFYNEKAKRNLYVDGKKYWNMDAGKCTFFGAFTKLPKDFPVDWNKYNIKKDEATAHDLDTMITPKQAIKNTQKEFNHELKLYAKLKGWDCKAEDRAAILKLHRATIYKWDAQQ